MDESDARTLVLAALRPLDPIYVENAARAGCGDVNYVEGWLELKWLASWPKRPETPVNLPEFTPQQRVFLVKRCRAGGQARVLLRVGKSWLLIPGLWAALRLGKGATKSEIVKAAELYWLTVLGGPELAAWLSAPPRNDLTLLPLLTESGFISNV